MLSGLLIGSIVFFVVLLGRLLEHNYFVIPPKSIEELPKRMTYSMIGKGMFYLGMGVFILCIFFFEFSFKHSYYENILGFVFIAVIIAFSAAELLLQFFKLNTIRTLSKNKELLEAILKPTKIDKLIKNL